MHNIFPQTILAFVGFLYLHTFNKINNNENISLH